MATLFYFFFVLLLFLFTLPLQALVAVAVLVGSGFPIFYRQKRVGKGGKMFVMYKFRTMTSHAGVKQSSLRERNESAGPTFKIHDDPRFTPIGKFLSHTGLDELPQIWNVLRGEMALIGPRPLPVEEAKRLKPWMKKRHSVLPGIISPAILSGNYHSDFDAWMKSDVAYSQNKSVLVDTRLFFQSIVFLFRLFVREFYRAALE